MSSQTPTVLELIKTATAWLEKHGVPEARLNVEHLLARQLKKKSRMELYLEFDRPVGESELAPLREQMRRRSKREPLQHLLGDVEFYGRRFLCDSRALIPRPETEQLVELVCKSCQGMEAPHFLDVGTGSGVIAVTLALEFPDATVLATDISADALALAAENAALLGVKDRVHFHQTHLVPRHEVLRDAVVANLPYIPSDQIAGLAPEVHFDPLNALDGGPDGLDLVRKLIHLLPTAMKPGASLFLELGIGQCDLLSDELQSQTSFSLRADRDYQDVLRFLTVQYG